MLNEEYYKDIESIKVRLSQRPSMLRYLDTQPVHFDNSLDLYETLSNYMAQLHYCLELMEELTKINSEILDWFNGEGAKVLREQINEILKMWLESGKIKEIINEEILKEINEKVNGVVDGLKELEERFNKLESDLTSQLANMKNEMNKNIDNHKNDKTNPHKVTSEQVGAYSKQEANDTFVKKDGLSEGDVVWTGGLLMDKGTTIELSLNNKPFEIKNAKHGLRLRWIRFNKETRKEDSSYPVITFFPKEDKHFFAMIGHAGDTKKGAYSMKALTRGNTTILGQEGNDEAVQSDAYWVMILSEVKTY